jgi:hypothetical protein
MKSLEHGARLILGFGDEAKQSNRQRSANGSRLWLCASAGAAR